MTYQCDDDFDDYGEGCMCPHCGALGSVPCHCGGDLCVCENYGDRDCPVCCGEGSVSNELYNKYMENQRIQARLWDEARRKAEGNSDD